MAKKPAKKQKRKPERTPQNKAMEAPENKELIHRLHTNQPIRPPVKRKQ